jgi:hypothetical protein
MLDEELVNVCKILNLLKDAPDVRVVLDEQLGMMEKVFGNNTI